MLIHSNLSPLARRASAWGVAACSALMCLPAQAQIAPNPVAPGTYIICDHGYGREGEDYGLRMDSINGGVLLSAELDDALVFLTWDGGEEAFIAGQLFNPDDGTYWEIDFTVTGITLVEDGWVADAGSGSLTHLATNEVFPLIGKQDHKGDAFELLADGHRIPHSQTAIVLRGWHEPNVTSDDWLAIAKYEEAPIPEPASVSLLLLGAGALGLRRRRA